MMKNHSIRINFLSRLLVLYLRLVHATVRIHYECSDISDTSILKSPLIIASWHDQSMMLPFICLSDYLFNNQIKILLSRSRDGEIVARALQKLGINTIRASGGRNPSHMIKKGGLFGMVQMIQELQQEKSIAMTPDIVRYKPRYCGMGIIALAKLSGRPVLPIGYETNKKYVVSNSHDKMSIILPFSKIFCCVGKPVFVDKDLDCKGIEILRQKVEESLNLVTERSQKMASSSDF